MRDVQSKQFHETRITKVACPCRRPITEPWLQELHPFYPSHEDVKTFKNFVESVARKNKQNEGEKTTDGPAGCGLSFAAGNPMAKQVQKGFADIIGMFLCVCRHTIPIVAIDVLYPGGEGYAYALMCLLWLSAHGFVPNHWWYDINCKWYPWAKK